MTSFEQINGLPPRDVCEALGVTVSRESGGRLYCCLPDRESKSEESFQIDSTGEKPLFIDRATGIGGDLVQLPEYILFGEVTKTEPGEPLSEGLRESLRFYAERFGIETSCEGETFQKDGGLEALDGFVTVCQEELLSEEHKREREWLFEKHGFGEDAIRRFRLGLCTRAVLDKLCARGFGATALLKSGAFWPAPGEPGLPGGAHFLGRLVFPYLSIRGKAEYAIARETPWTYEGRDKETRKKYVKLLLHSKEHPWVSPQIRNVLFNGHALRAGKHVIIVEGIADALRLMLESFEGVVSPVTTHVQKSELPGLVRALKRAKRGFLCMDNEANGQGGKAVAQLAKELVRAGIPAYAVELPLGEAEKEARAQLEALPADAPGRKELEAKAKVDVSSWFLSGGGTAEAFRTLMDEAPDFITGCLEKIEFGAKGFSGAGFDAALEEALELISCGAPADDGRHLDVLKKRLGKRLGKKEAQRRVSELRWKREEKGKPRLREEDPGYCKALVQAAIAEAEVSRRPVSWTSVAEKVFEALKKQGAMPFLGDRGGFLLLPGGATVPIEAHTDDEVRERNSFFFELTGENFVLGTRKDFFETLANRTHREGTPAKDLGWLHFDPERARIFFDCQLGENRILKITPEGVVAVPNGFNEERVLLRPAEDFPPLQFDPSVDICATYKLVLEEICPAFTCREELRELPLLWMMSSLLYDAVGTKALLKMTGGAGSGKTSILKTLAMLSRLSEKPDELTIAAAYQVSSRQMFTLEDNLEAPQLTEAKTHQQLLVASGAERRKMAQGGEGVARKQRVRALCASTGIGGVRADRSEIQGRFIFLPCYKEEKRAGFIESRQLEKAKKLRGAFWSMAILATSRVLRLYAEGGFDRARLALETSCDLQEKNRLFDFLTLIYLLRAVLRNEGLENLDVVDPKFVKMLEAVAETSVGMQSEGNVLAMAFARLFQVYRVCSEPVESDSGVGHWPNPSTFTEKTFLVMNRCPETDVLYTDRLKARDLLNALKALDRSYGALTTGFSNAQELGSRLSSEVDLLRASGFGVVVERDSHCHTLTYQIFDFQDMDPELQEETLRLVAAMPKGRKARRVPTPQLKDDDEFCSLLGFGLN